MKESRGRGVLGPGSRPGRQRMCGRELASSHGFNFQKVSPRRRPGEGQAHNHDVFDERDWSSEPAPQRHVGMDPASSGRTEYVAAFRPKTWNTFLSMDAVSRSRGTICPRCSVTVCSLDSRGSRECRVRAAPAVSCARCTKKSAHEHTGSAEAVRHSLRNGFTAYAALSPATNSSCHRRCRLDG